MAYSLNPSSDNCYEGTTCLVNKLGIHDEKLIRHYGYDINFADVDTDELMIATFQASSGVIDFLVEFFENSIIIPD